MNDIYGPLVVVRKEFFVEKINRRASLTLQKQGPDGFDLIRVRNARDFRRSVEIFAERFALLFELVNDRDQQSGSELARHSDRFVHDLGEGERSTTVALRPIDDLVRRIDPPAGELVQM
jgi:hypothetical protein